MTIPKNESIFNLLTIFPDSVQRFMWLRSLGGFRQINDKLSFFVELLLSFLSLWGRVRLCGVSCQAFHSLGCNVRLILRPIVSSCGIRLGPHRSLKLHDKHHFINFGQCVITSDIHPGVWQPAPAYHLKTLLSFPVFSKGIDIRQSVCPVIIRLGKFLKAATFTSKWFKWSKDRSLRRFLFSDIWAC